MAKTWARRQAVEVAWDWGCLAPPGPGIRREGLALCRASEALGLLSMFSHMVRRSASMAGPRMTPRSDARQGSAPTPVSSLGTLII